MPQQPPKEDGPFTLNLRLQGRPVLNRTFHMTRGVVASFLRLRGIEQIYLQARRDESRKPFANRLLDVMNLDYELPEGALEMIPKEGPVIAVANHPFGGVEGIVLASLLGSARPDARILANYILGRIPELRDSFILVDPFGTRDAVRANLKPMKESMRWLRQGGLLGVFPSGEVSHVDIRRRKVVDPPWSTTIGGLVRHTQATVVPIFFEGANGPLFQLAGLVHPRLRTVMLPQQVLNKRNRTLGIQIGHPITADRLKDFDSDRELVDFLRLRTYALASRDRGKQEARLPFAPRAVRRRQKPVAPPQDAAKVTAEVARLPAEQKLHVTGDFEVYYATTPQIPDLLLDIGRARELTFRAVGEGSGNARDLDRFDAHYTHLFVWNAARNELVGAYRLGLADRIIEKRGIRGLYTSTLFRFNRRFINKISPAVELGRSFIVPEYQKAYLSLMLLWRGIGLYLVRHPQYTTLFGPVSITADYTDMSRHLLMRTLRLNTLEPELAPLVRPRNPPRGKPRRWDNAMYEPILDDVEQVNELVKEIEKDSKGMPVLLKQYLKLGGRLLAFNVDNAFSSVLDGLIAVDLRKTDQRILCRFLGKENTENFLAHHGISVAPCPEGNGAQTD